MVDDATQMREAQVEEFRSNWPREEVLDNEGCVHITGSYIDPELVTRALIAGSVAMFGWLTVAWLFYPFGATHSDALLGGTALAVVPIFALATLIAYFRRKRVDVKIGPEFIVIDGRRYSRDAVTEFRAQLPSGVTRRLDKYGAVTQQQAHEKEVVMQYGERTIPVAHFRGRDIELARALIIRLQAWHERFNLLRKRTAAEEHAAAQTARADEFGPAPPIR